MEIKPDPFAPAAADPFAPAAVDPFAPAAAGPFALQPGAGGSDPFAAPGPVPLDLPPPGALSSVLPALDRPIVDTIRAGASWAMTGLSRALTPRAVGDPFAPVATPWAQGVVAKALMGIALLACLACAARSLLSLVSTASTAAAVLAVVGLASSWTSPAAAGGALP